MEIRELNNAKWDCQIITAGDEEINFLYYDKFQPQNTLVPLRAVRQDTGANPNEIRPGSGDFFSQGDFSGGMGQPYFHQSDSDPAKCFYLQGFDNTIPGRLKHARDVTTLPSGYDTINALVSHGGALTTVGRKTSNSTYYTLTSDGATWTEAAAPNSAGALDLTSDGTYLYAIENSGSTVYRRTGSTWASYNALVCNLIEFIKDRIIAVRTSNGEVYEIVSGSTPTAFDTLPAEWTPNSIFASGEFVYVIAYHGNAGPFRSAIFAYGLNDAGTALERKAVTDPPIGFSARYGVGYQGRVFFTGFRSLGTGVVGALFSATPLDDGSLSYQLIAESRYPYEGTEEDYPGPILAESRSVALPWAQEADSFNGMAKFDLATGSFSLLGDSSLAFGNDPVAAAWVNGARYWTDSNTVFLEDLTKYEPTATLITSLADWNNAGLKVWQSAEIAYAKPLPSTASVSVYYTTKHPDEDDWTLIGTDSTAASTGKKWVPPTPITARQFALKIVSSATTNQADAPELSSFSVRSDPTVDTGDIQWQLQRVVRLVPMDSKGTNPNVPQKPRELRTALMNLAHQPFTFKEGPDTWKVRMVAPSGDFVPHLTNSDVTLPESSPKDGYLFQLTLEGSRS